MASADCSAINAEDGALEYVGAFGGTWANARAASGGSWNKDGSANDASYFIVNADYNVGFSVAYAICRGFLSFDLSSIPAGATVSGVVLHVKGYNVSSGAGGSVALQEGTQGSALTTADWSAFNSTELITRVNFSSLTGSGWNDLTLNASGVSVVQNALAAGKVQFCVRSSFDVDNSAPTSRSFLAARFGEYTGTSDDPYLTVTYTAPVSRTAGDSWGWSDGAQANRVSRTAGDAWAWSDSGTRTSSRSRAATDSWAWTDTARYVAVYTAGDSWAWTDSPARTLRGPGASPTTLNPNGDASVSQGPTPSSWSSIAETGSGTVDSSGIVFKVEATSSGGNRTLRRGFLSFDVSAVSGPVASAVLRLVPSSTYGLTSSGGGSLSIVNSNAAATPSTTDYAQLGSTKYAADVDYASLVANTYNEFPLNDAGLAYLSGRVGVGDARFGLRSSFDLTATEPTGSSVAPFVATENGSYKPELVIYPLVPVARAGDSWGWSDAAEWDRGTAHSRAAQDAWGWHDSATPYRRQRASVLVVPEGANTTISGAQNPSGGTITVASTSEFASSGEAFIIDTANDAACYPQAMFRYTSKDATHFYGCTSDSGEWNQTFNSGSSVATLDNESHFPQLNVLDDSETPELLVTFHQHAAHAAINGQVVGVRSLDGGMTWGSPFVVTTAVGGRGGTKNRKPGIYGHTLIRLSDGKLFLSWYEHRLDYHDVETYTRYSADNGRTWSAAVKVPDQFGSNLQGQGTGCGIVEYGGEIYMAVYGWEGSTSYLRTPDDAFVKLVKTADLGQTWALVSQIVKGGVNGAPVRGFNETSLLILPDGTWLAQHRAEVNATSGFTSLDRYQTISTDHGATWGTTTRVVTGLANTPVLHQMPDGTLLSQGMNAGSRSPIGTGEPVTFFTADYNNWQSTNYRAESIDATYTQGNGGCFRNVTNPPTSTRRTVNAYAMERASQAGAQVRFQWYSIPGFHLAADAWAWSDTAARAVTRSSTASDTWGWSDSPARTTSAARTASDAWAWSDTATGVRVTARTSSDSWAWSDAAARSVSTARGAADTWAWSDTPSRQVAESRTAADTWAWSDSASQVLGHSSSTGARTAADSWAWTDSAAGPRVTPATYPRTAADIWLWQDQVSRPVTPSPPEDPGYRLTFDIGPYL